MDDIVSVTVRQCERQTDKAFLIRLSGVDRANGQPVELESWWPKSQISYRKDSDQIRVPKWLLDKKVEEKFGPDSLIDIV